MTKKEIATKYDEIVEFSGCERYIDTPVKRYSSGMTVRLAFAVAAFLEPDILIIDEVLAVGDAEFQMKAIGKMQDISKGEGRTVLFVSHDMTAIRNLCPKTLLLKNGEVLMDELSKRIWIGTLGMFGGHGFIKVMMKLTTILLTLLASNAFCFEDIGIASHYSVKTNKGVTTKSGIPLNDKAFTAAHPTLNMGEFPNSRPIGATFLA